MRVDVPVLFAIPGVASPALRQLLPTSPCVSRALAEALNKKVLFQASSSHMHNNIWRSLRIHAPETWQWASRVEDAGAARDGRLPRNLESDSGRCVGQTQALRAKCDFPESSNLTVGPKPWNLTAGVCGADAGAACKGRLPDAALEGHPAAAL